MRVRTIALAGMAALLLGRPAIASDAHGWYLGLGAGWDRLGDIDIRYSPNGANDFLHSSNAALFTGSLGYRLTNGIRFEMELGWDRHDLHSTGVGSTNDNGRINEFTGAVNALYDWRITNRWAFSFGGGVGVARTDLDITAPDQAGGIINVANGRQSGFMAQAIAGFTYSISDNIDLDLDWRYRDFAGQSFSTSRPFASGDLRNNNEQVAMLGLRWYFEPASPPPLLPPPAAAPPAPPLPPSPPAPPPPVPPVKTFIVFFDFNKSDLTAEAQAVVTEAVKTAKQQGAVHILVTGHTDTVGSHNYNQGLSERRAASVKAEMVRQGMTAAEIAAEGKSFDDPLVPIGPDVREPQNRRAMIDLGGGS